MENKILELEKQIKEACEKKERAISQAQQTKQGHVYIISNLGSFGEEDSDKAPLIKKGFELAATGQYSLRTLKRKLYDMGLRGSNAGRELCKDKMQKVLRSPFYLH